ncbi:MAG: transporter related [Sporomusa sp.]|jgi:ATP-binding cassette subfamily B protein|nr:transporter related [Sporomusa sp.]
MTTNENTRQGYRLVNVLKLMKKLQPYRGGIICAVLSGVFHHVFTIGAAVICAYIVGLALEGLLLEKIRILAFVLALLIVGRAVMYYSEMWFAHDVAFKILKDFRIMLLNAIEKVSPSILLTMRSGQLASTLMSDVEVLEWFFAHTFGSVLIAVIVPAAILIFMGSLHLLLPLIMLAFIAVTVLLPFLMKNKADQQGLLVRDRLAEANAVTVEGVQGMKEILTLNYLDQYREKNQRYMQAMYQSQLHYGQRLGTEGAMLQIAVGLSLISIMAVAAGMVFKGSLDFALFPVVITLAGMIFNPVLDICNTARNFGLIFAAANRVHLVLEAKPLVVDTGKSLNIAKLVPEIEFSGVSFRYRAELDNALSRVSFTVKPGETVALVGASGAGKSTCINLLLRCWDVAQGSIKIGSADIRDMSLDNVRSLTSVVLQEVYLFNTSIRDNIRLGNIQATDRQVELAARAAQAHDFIMSLPQGYETKAGERGLHFSGGQRQRIAIARAILKDSPILILDEAVSSLDSENENEIQRTLRKYYGKCTTLVVAHRLSTIMAADRLVVMNGGRVVQTGSHEELIAREGFYRDLVMSQFAGESKMTGTEVAATRLEEAQDR